MSEAALESTSTGADWNDVMHASAEDVKREEVTDVIDVPANPVRITAKLVDIDNEIKRRRSAFDAAKLEAKARKADLESAEGERDDLIDSLRTGVEQLAGNFIIEDRFREGLTRWFIKDTGEMVKEAPMEPERRQEALPFPLESKALDEGGTIPPPPMSSVDDVNGFSGSSPDDTDIDALSLMKAAQSGGAPEMAKPPSKPIKRGKKAQEVAS